ncbi:MAG: nucleotidyltransferase domain-containing protein [Spirochaetota bacterium]|jgi:predicted nucleotidyltransferase
MRLTDFERQAIAQVVQSCDPSAKVYLFGSRADDAQKGGDIDLLIISDKIHLKEKIKIRLALYDKLGEQKIDIVVSSNGADPFARLALKNGVPLYV